MGTSRILTGARALVMMNNNPIGIFTSCTWSIRQDKTPAFVLGHYGPVEITPTAQEAVSMSLTGFRVANHGPYSKTGMSVPMLKELLTENDFTIYIYDRGPQDGSQTVPPATSASTPVFKAFGCRVNGWSSGVAARGVSDIRIEVIGLKAGDETTGSDEDEGGTAPSFPGN